LPSTSKQTCPQPSRSSASSSTWRQPDKQYASSSERRSDDADSWRENREATLSAPRRISHPRSLRRGSEEARRGDGRRPHPTSGNQGTLLVPLHIRHVAPHPSGGCTVSDQPKTITIEHPGEQYTEQITEGRYIVYTPSEPDLNSLTQPY